MNVKGIIFDMDGTLIDSEAVYLQSLMKTAKDLAIPFSQDHYQQLIGLSNEEFHLMCHRWFDHEFGEKKIHQFIEQSTTYGIDLINAGRAPLKFGAIELLDYCQENGIKRTVASNNDRLSVNVLLEKTKISHYFEQIFAMEDVSYAKPHPEIYLKALDYLGLEKHQVVVIEDSIAGIQASNAANIPVIMVPDLVQPSENLSLLAVQTNLKEVLSFLEQQA